jgi:hypothetical protein
MNNLQELLNKTLTPKQTFGIISTFSLFIMLVVFASYDFQNKNNVASVSVATEGNLSSVDTTNCPTEQARSISQHGVTWFFDKCYQYGTYANGDYWVVGPVTITDINPPSSV